MEWGKWGVIEIILRLHTFQLNFPLIFFNDRNSAATSAPPPYLCVCDYCRRERVRVNVVTSCCWLRGQVIYGSPYPDWETNISTHNHPLHLSPSLNVSLLPPPSSSLPNSILHPLSLIQSSHHPHLPASWFILFIYFLNFAILLLLFSPSNTLHYSIPLL